MKYLVVKKNNTIISNRLAILEFLDFFGGYRNSRFLLGILYFARNSRIPRLFWGLGGIFTLGILDLP